MTRQSTAAPEMDPRPIMTPASEEVSPQNLPDPAASDISASGAGFTLGLQENGDFLARLAGREFRLNAAEIAMAQLDLSARAQPIPGLHFQSAHFDSRQRKLVVDAGVTVPGLDSGALTLELDREGRARLRGRMQRAFNLPALGRSILTVGLDDGFALTGSAEIPAANLAPLGISGLSVNGSGIIRLESGRLSGEGNVEITYADLGSGSLRFGFDQQGGFTGSGEVTITPPFMEAVTADLSADAAGNITAHAEIPVNGKTSPIPRLELTAGSLTLDYLNGRPELVLSGFAASFAGFGRIALASLRLGPALRPEGAGIFEAAIPMLDTATGEIRVAAGRISGEVTIGRDSFPAGLPIRSGAVTAALAPDGALAFAGNLTADFGPAGTAVISAGYGPDGLALSGSADLTVPGLNPVRLTTSYANGDLAGSVNVPVDSQLIPGLSGDVTIRFAEGRWSGETALSYSADGGKLSGTVTVTVAQTEAGGIALGGSGQVTARLMPGLEGMLSATILAEGGIDVSGEIVVTDPYQLFPEQRLERELFSYSQNIPLWGILVAVIRVRAGIRAGIGPGVFRDIRVSGSYRLGSEEAEPSFRVSGEMYIPAFVEGYVAFGAGLGLDVLLGSLTGGIEGVATAGIYGAISVVPELSYADGNWSIDGTATLAAGARLKLGLNAWAEIEALWVTVWGQTWNLAEVVMPVGPDLALQAKMHYTFGQAEAPQLDFNTSDIDTESLIAGAMPKDGPPGSGARDALENKAQWQGALREQRAAKVPPEMAARASESPDAPAAPAKPPPKAPPGGAAAARAVAGEGQVAAPPETASPETQDAAIRDAASPDPNATATVPATELPIPDAPRYPTGISLAMLDEPPVPATRSHDQEVEDVAAAKKVLELASAAVTDTDALDNYFPRIRNRFRLTSIGYEGDFATGFRIAIAINPSDWYSPSELVVGEGLPTHIPHKTVIRNDGLDRIYDETVGTGMAASPLGPDHPKGTDARGQDKLMSRLPTDMRLSSEEKFVRGHLLNQELGGEGRAENLFPITASANASHLSAVEADVKKWVNEKRLWVSYQVSITNVTKPKKAKPGATNYVNATIVAVAKGLTTDLGENSLFTRKVSISSKIAVTSETDVTETGDKDRFEGQTMRDEDRDLVIQTSKDGPQFATDRVEMLREALRRTKGDRGRIDTALLKVREIGPQRLAALWRAYDIRTADPARELSDQDALFRHAISFLMGPIWADIAAKLAEIGQ